MDTELILTKQINRVLPTIKTITIESLMEITTIQYSINDSLLFGINNIDCIKFDTKFNYVISDFNTIHYSIGVKCYKTIDPEIIKCEFKEV